MTIAFVFEIFYPIVNGILTASHSVALNLTKQGHRVIYIAPKWGKSTQHEIEGIPVHYVTSYETFIYPGMRNVVPWSKHVRKIIEREGVDIVHATGPWLLNWAALRAARKLNRATVQTFHTMLNEASYIRYGTRNETLVKVVQTLSWRYFGLYMRYSDAVTAPSDYVTEKIAARYPDVRVLHIPNGVDLSTFQNPPSLAQTRRRYPFFHEKSFIFIGRLGPEKSVDRLISGFAQAHYRQNDLKLIIVGDGPGREEYERQVRELRLGTAVHFTGRLSPQELYTQGLLHHALANVTASTTETFGMTVVEAMACGTPSIVANVPGISELTAKTGYTFEQNDLTSLEQTLVHVANHPEERERYVQACRVRVKEFDSLRIAKRFSNLYAEILTRRG